MFFPSLRPRVRTAAPNYTYFQGMIFTPGAEAMVFNTNLQLPLFLVQANGTIPFHNPPSVVGAPQVFAGHVTPTVGLGGLQHGQLFTQPLSNMRGVSDQ